MPWYHDNWDMHCRRRQPKEPGELTVPDQGPSQWRELTSAYNVKAKWLRKELENFSVQGHMGTYRYVGPKSGRRSRHTRLRAALPEVFGNNVRLAPGPKCDQSLLVHLHHTQIALRNPEPLPMS